MEITDISTGNIIAKGAANHVLAREGKNISCTSFAVSTSIVDPAVSVYEIEIQGDSDLDLVPTSKLESRKMTGNPSDT